jgi:hypothetical protein
VEWRSIGLLLVQVVRAHQATTNAQDAGKCTSLLEQFLEASTFQNDRWVRWDLNFPWHLDVLPTLARHAWCIPYRGQPLSCGTCLKWGICALQCREGVQTHGVLKAHCLCSNKEEVRSAVLMMLDGCLHPTLKVLAEPCLEAILSGIGQSKVRHCGPPLHKRLDHQLIFATIYICMLRCMA